MAGAGDTAAMTQDAPKVMVNLGAISGVYDQGARL